MATAAGAPIPQQQTPQAPQAVASTASVIPLASWILQGASLVGVVGLIFFIGVWKGEVGTKIDQLRIAQDKQAAASEKVTDTVNQVNQRLARIEGLLEGAPKPLQKSQLPKKAPERATVLVARN